VGRSLQYTTVYLRVAVHEGDAENAGNAFLWKLCRQRSKVITAVRLQRLEGIVTKRRLGENADRRQ
jgi:hypothetical protein